MAQTSSTTYEIDPMNVIFTSVTQTFTDDTTGSFLASSPPHRTPWPPGSIAADNPDPRLLSLAATVHTPAVIAAYQATVAASIAAAEKA